MLTITIDSRIRFDPKKLPKDVLGHVQEALLMPNPDKAVARKQKIPGWQRQPDFIRLYHEAPGLERGSEMWLPRGFARDFFDGLEACEIEYEVEDWTSSSNSLIQIGDGPAHELRAHQEAAIQAFIDAQASTYGCGILEAPPGSGKTITVLELIRRFRTSAVIVVNTTNIAAQWQDRIRDYLGVDAGMIGDGVMDFRPDGITLATVQTLYNLPFVHEVFEVGLACMDEVHHVSAITFSAVMERFTSEYRLGVSATPDRSTGWFDAVKAVIGPVVHQVTKEELADAGFLVRPTIHRVHTEFSHYYQPTETYRAKQTCDTPNCEKAGRPHSHRTNYTQVVEALARNRDRCRLIAEVIADYPEGRHLVVSRRHAQLEAIERAVEEAAPGLERHMLTGKETTAERMRVAAEAAARPCVVFSTIADEALDIPQLDHIHLAWPTKNPAVVTQQLGRVERAHPGKIEAHVWDYVDRDVGVLFQQSRKRFSEVYRPGGYTVLGAD